jgi:hypothetical protein
MKIACFVLPGLFLSVGISAQPLLMKGSNKLYPQNLMVTYAVNFEKLEDETDSTVLNDTLSSFTLSNEYPGASIIDNALSGRTPVYQTNDYDQLFPYTILESRKKLPMETISELLGVKTIVPQGGGKDEVIRKVVNIGEIRGFEFIEDWNWDQQTDRFTKNVVAYNPIRIYSEPERIIHRRTFYVMDTCYSGKKQSSARIPVLMAKSQYEFYINRDWCEKKGLSYANLSIPFNYDASDWSKSMRIFFVKNLCDPVINGTKQVLDYKTRNSISMDEARLRLGFRCDSVMIDDYENGIQKMILTCKDFNPARVKSVIFFEDWFIDPVSLLISKQVTGIAPVLYPDEEIDEHPGCKEIPFIVPFVND